MRLIDADALYEQTAEWENRALRAVEKTMDDEDKTEWQKWSTILAERSAFKFDVADAPTVDAVEVVRCKDCDMWNEEDFSGRKGLGNYRCACDEWANHEDGRRVYTGPDEFCSRGERRRDE